MEINRKRVAKRLVSGLVAGALALGGLALSGGSPASAVTPQSPTTQRLAGDDRYETAAAIARDQVAPLSSTGLVIVSGESTADSLAAASLATSTRPILLVRSNSIPEATADFIQDYRADWANISPKIYVVGGPNAISAEVFDALSAAVAVPGDTSPAKPVRVAGDDRYATSAEIAKITLDSSDKLIIVNGAEGKWADALAVGPLASKGTWPILLTNGSTVSDAVKAQIDAYYALPGSAQDVLIIGGPAAVSPAVESYLLSDDVGFAVNDIRRIGGVDRYQTSLLVNAYMASESQFRLFVAGPFNGRVIALASGVSPWDALAASGWANSKNSHIQLVPPSGSDAMSTTLFGLVGTLYDGASSATTKVYLLGGKTVMPPAALAAATGASTAGNLTSTLTDCNEGGSTATLILSGQLSNSTGHTESSEFVAGSATANARFRLNSVDRTVVGGPAGIVVTDLGPFVTGVPDRRVYRLTLVGTTLSAESVLEFRGWAEGQTYGTHVANRSIAGSSCTVSDDTTSPSVSLRRAYIGTAAAVTSSAAPRIELRFSEPVTVGATSLIPIGGVTVGASATGSPATVSPLNSTGTAYLIQFHSSDTNASITAGVVVKVGSSYFKDLAGNSVAGATIDMNADLAVDSTPPVLTPTSVECIHKGSDTSQYSMTRGNLRFTTSETGKFAGAKGAGFKLTVVNQRGLEKPTIAVDETAKTVTVTADTLYHSPEDVIAVAAENWLTNPLLGNWTVSSPAGAGYSATVTPVSAIGGKSRCFVDFSASEAIIVDNGAVALGGSLSGLGTASVVNPTPFDYTTSFGKLDATKPVRISFTAMIDTAALGSGSLVLSASNGVTNVSDVYVPLPVEFTLS